jgi:hypothetical protein
MSRARGGYIGFNRVPAAAGVNSAASGVWSLREAEALKRAGTWPLAAPGGVGSGLQLWLDAADSGTLFDATTGGSLVAADGTVKRWEDKSGNARHATEATNGPTRKLAIQGGKDVLRFNGTTQFLQGSSTPTSGNVRTVFLVAKSDTSAGGETFQIGTRPGNSWAGFIVRCTYSSPTSFIGGDITTNNLTIANTQLAITSAFSACLVQSSTSSFSYFHNGVSYSVTGSLASFNAAAGYFVGKVRSDTDLGFLDGDICEIIVYDSALSSTNREAVETYLLAKWGIT